MSKHLLWPFLILLIFVRYVSTRPIYKDGDGVRITTTVYTDPIVYTTSQYLKIDVLKIYLPLTPVINYGDKIIIEGTIKGDQLKNAKLISAVPGGIPFLSRFRNAIIDFYQSTLPQPESGLLAGIVLGSKRNIPQAFYDQTKLAGVAHIIVALGTNVTFVTSFISGTLFAFLPRKRAIPFVIINIIIYLFVAGFDAPLIRAAIMSSVLFLGQEIGRVINPWRVFFIAIGIMLAVNPVWLTDTGFQLSFSATAGLMLLQKKIENLFKFLPGIIKQDLSTSLAAQIGVLPIQYFVFGYINILSPLINLLVLWTVAPLMVIGVLGGVVGLIIPQVGKLILYLGYPMLWWFVGVVNIFS